MIRPNLIKNYKPNVLNIKLPQILFDKFKEYHVINNNYEKVSLLKRKKVLGKNSKLKKWVSKIKKKLKSKNPAIIIDLRKCLINENDKINTFRAFNAFLTIFFGEMLIQDSNKKKIISVYDRDKSKSMKKGARYHQTHEGGSIHTDNVNIPDYWDYLIFSCVAQAPKGGQSLIVDGNKVYEILKKKFPKKLKILERNFWFEKRGLSNSLFKSPIILNKRKLIKFRYLRPYLESAHKKARDLLTNEQIKALNVLDSILENSRYQKRFKLKEFQTLVTLDFRILHGRTSFKDYPKAINLDKYNPAKKQRLKRTMDRMWIKEI